MTENEVLDLRGLVKKTEIKIISGKDRGINVRKEYQLDELDASDKTIEVFLPEHLKVITPSFAMGLFAKSVLECGSVDAFMQKYIFKNCSFLVLGQIKKAAKLSLTEITALQN